MEEVDLGVTHLRSSNSILTPGCEMYKVNMFHGNIMAMELVDSPDDDFVVGEFQFTIFSGILEEILEDMDAHSQEMVEYGHVFEKNFEYHLSPMAVVERIKIEPKYRGHMLGLQAMESILHFLQSMGTCSAVARAWLYEDKEAKESPTWLQEYWEKAGWELVDDGYMIMNLEFILPEIEYPPVNNITRMRRAAREGS